MLRTRLAAAQRRRSLQQRTAQYFPAPTALAAPSPYGNEDVEYRTLQDWHDSRSAKDRLDQMTLEDVLALV